MQHDYYAVLARAIGSITQDEAQLRRMIYELARLKLRRQLLFQAQDLGRAGIDRQVLEFETAIEQIELDIAQNLPLLSGSNSISSETGNSVSGPTNTDLVLHQPGSAAATLNANLTEILGPTSYSPVQRVVQPELLPPLSQFYAEPRSPRRSESSQSKSWFKIQLITAVILGVAIYAAIERGPFLLRQMGWRIVYDSPQTTSRPDSRREPPSAAVKAMPPPIPNTPIPANYGVYAADGGKLTELEPLPIRVPDRRISISGVISAPSQSIIPDGHVQFIVYRRDLAISVPDQVTVRVVAQVVRALTFTDGKAVTSPVEGAWAVRGNAYEMKVAPVDGNTEMVVIRPSQPDFAFPAGRYALVLKTVAYDFTVAGPITDVSHCLERTDTVNVPVYSECRSP
jgi:hypothetical protein